MDTAQASARGVTTAQTQLIVVTDPIAFRFLAEDPASKVISQRTWLEGFECSVVEQWACSRTDPSIVITTYSGDPSHRILANVLQVPEDEGLWGPRLSEYHDGLKKYNATPRASNLGTVMVTNLSSFPSSLTVIPVPDGDLRAHREIFYINEDLKRLNCSGRVGITLSKPNAATVAKFYQQYRVSEKIPLNDAVVELVKMCQIALTLFDKLDPDYADGLLCDKTEQAITDWWLEFGNEQYNIEPHDGILGPSTVAALLGMLIGARNRLNAYGAPIGKDVFDIESTKRGIAYFQKTHRIPKSRRLDRQTLTRLRKSTAKAASGDGWFVPRAVKSTMASVSGKGGEMVMDMVGARDKSGIADVETADMAQFVQLVQGTKAKWLWQGKGKLGKPSRSERNADKAATDDPRRSLDEASNEWSPLQLVSSAEGTTETLEERERNKLSKKAPTDRSGPAKPQDTGRGLGRIKGAVGLRHHSTRHIKDPHEKTDENSGSNGLSQQSAFSTERSPWVDSLTTTEKPRVSQEAAFSPLAEPQFTRVISETPVTDLTIPTNVAYFERVEPPSDSSEKDVESQNGKIAYTPSPLSRSPTPSIKGPHYKGVDLDELFEGNPITLGSLFRRRQSFTDAEEAVQRRHNAYWQRHLSFSLAEEGLSSWEAVIHQFYQQESGVLTTDYDVELARRLRRDLRDLEHDVAPWVKTEINKVQHVERILSKEQEELASLNNSQSAEFQEAQRDSKDVIDYEREQLTEAAKEIETLGAMLEYEVNALDGKVEDLEIAVDEFERQVIGVEGGVAQLVKSMEPKESWSHLAMRTFRISNTSKPHTNGNAK